MPPGVEDAQRNRQAGSGNSLGSEAVAGIQRWRLARSVGKIFLNSPLIDEPIRERNLTALLDQPPTKPAFVRIEHRGTPQWKRAVDLVGFAVLLPIVTPLFIFVAAYIKLVSPGAVFFVQSRVGVGGQLFKIYKFRTMRVPSVSRDQQHREYLAHHSGSDQPFKKPCYQKDLIRGGNLLRKLSIDELPQLLNVCKGEMSLVGPRPDLLQVEDYEPWQLRRFEVLPGMTGLWQVSGKNRLSFEQMIQLDIEYIENRSLLNDLVILLKTVRVLLFERNE